MAHLNLRDRLIETTIAYVGADEGWGAANFAHVKRDVQRGRAGALEHTEVGGGRLLSLDWRPRDAAKLNDCELTVKLVSTEGNVEEDAMQRVLVPADGLVLVLESDPDDEGQDRNQRALATVREALARAPEKKVPVVVQVNQRDDESGPPRLETLVIEEWPRVTARAGNGDGIMETLQRAVDVVVESMRSHPGTPAATPPRAAGTPRVEGNPLLAALRQILQATVTEQMAALESRVLDRIEAQASVRDATSQEMVARLSSFEAWLNRFDAAVAELRERASGAVGAVGTGDGATRADLERTESRLSADANAQRDMVAERLTSFEAWMERLESVVIDVGKRGAASAERAASKADVERVEKAVLAEAQARQGAVDKRFEMLEAAVERTESSVVEASERVTMTMQLAATKADVERAQARVVNDAATHREALLGEVREYRKTIRDEVSRAAVGATQPMSRVLDGLSVEVKKWVTTETAANVAGAMEKAGEKSEAVRGQVETLAGDLRAMGKRLDDLATQVQQVDAHVGRRMAEVRETLRTSAEKNDGRAEAVQSELTALAEELRKKKSWWG